MAMKVDNSLTSSVVLAATHVASSTKSGGGKFVTNRNGANGVFDNQRMQAVAEALGRGDVSDTTVNG